MATLLSVFENINICSLMKVELKINSLVQSHQLKFEPLKYDQVLIQ